MGLGENLRLDPVQDYPITVFVTDLITLKIHRKTVKIFFRAVHELLIDSHQILFIPPLFFHIINTWDIYHWQGGEVKLEPEGMPPPYRPPVTGEIYAPDLMSVQTKLL